MKTALILAVLVAATPALATPLPARRMRLATIVRFEESDSHPSVIRAVISRACSETVREVLRYDLPRDHATVDIDIGVLVEDNGSDCGGAPLEGVVDAGLGFVDQAYALWAISPR